MTHRFFDDPPNAKKRIDELYVWVAIHADGGEGIISADMPFNFGGQEVVRHVPLICSDSEVAETLGTLARRIHGEAVDKGRETRIQLRRFVPAK